jgi:hypothetical protein
MNHEASEVFLRDCETGKLVEAKLIDAILPKHLRDHSVFWKPLSKANAEQHGHWDWAKKCSHYSKELSYQGFAIECNDATQGLMIVNTTKRCFLPSQANKHLVYIGYLESAPWNRKKLTPQPRFKGIGAVMIAAAIQLSLDEGNCGRIGLHSLPQSETYYKEKCQMTDLGPDDSYSPKLPLRYFEMTESQATEFLKIGGPQHET